MYKWNEIDTVYLKENYTTIPIQEIANSLGLKYQQVVSKASALGLNRKKRLVNLGHKKTTSY